jgi:hypothetical protein
VTHGWRKVRVKRVYRIHSVVLGSLLITLLVHVGLASTAAAATNWSSSGLTGVQASGTYQYTSAGQVSVSGRLYDTACDNAAAGIQFATTWTSGSTSYRAYSTSGQACNTSKSFSFSTGCCITKITAREFKFNTFWSQYGPWFTVVP